MPPPATQADEYAHAQVLELRRLNANLERLIVALTVRPAIEPIAGVVELREPEPAKRRKG